MLSNANMSGLLVASPVRATAAPTAFFPDSPPSDTLGADDLDLLSQLFAFPDPVDYSVAFQSDSVSSLPSTTKRERCVDCSSLSSEPTTKRLRTFSADGKANKCKSQSQRQKEEIALLKQQVEELNAQAKVLQERKHQRETAGMSASVSDAGSTDEDHWSTESDTSATSTAVVTQPASGSKHLWRRIAKRQLAELKSVEEENSSLRDEVAKRWKQMKSLERSIATAKVDSFGN